MERKKKKAHSGQTHAVIFKSQMARHFTVRPKHVEQNSFEGLHLIQQLSQRFSKSEKNNIDFSLCQNSSAGH